MNIKVFVWGCGVIVSLFGLILGLRSAARAMGVDPDEFCAVNSLPESQNDPECFSFDAFREELLK